MDNIIQCLLPLFAARDGKCVWIYALIVSYAISNDAVIFSDVHWSSAIKLSEYLGYKSVALMSYRIPQQTAQTSLNFEARTSGNNCNFKEVYIYLQHGGYPLVSPYNETYPENFHTNRTDAHHLLLEKNRGMTQVIMSSPKSGQWYFAAFLPKPVTNKIGLKEFDKRCSFGMFIVVESTGVDDIEEIALDKTNQVALKQDQDKRSVIFRFMLPEDSVALSVRMDNCSTSYIADRMSHNTFQPSANLTTTPNSDYIVTTLLSTENSSSVTKSEAVDSPYTLLQFPTACPLRVTADFERLPSIVSKHSKNCENQSSCQMDITSPKVRKWVYLNIALDPKYKIDEMNFGLQVSVERCESLRLVVPKTIMQVFGASRSSEYHAQDLTQDSCLMIDSLGRFVWTENTYNVTFLRAEHGVVPMQAPLKDLHILQHTVMVMNFHIEEMTDIGGTLKFYSEFVNNTIEGIDQFTVVHLCLMKNRIPGGKTVLTCLDGVQHILNTTSQLSKVTYIPYPEPGVWYLGVNGRCVHKNTGDLVPCDHVPQINLDLSISGCVDSQCGKYGQCRDYISGVHVFSACDCVVGWRGYGCTDGTEARSDQEELMAVLLLTLSNLFFIPAIVLAIYRKLFVEALVYTFTMFFSTFYHACDASNLIFYCMLKYDVLSFSDFLGSICSFLVTMLAMADIGSRPRNFVQLMGVLGVAVGVEYRRHGLWVFAVPSGLAAIIMFTSWVLRCKRTKTIYPSKRYLLTHFLPGLMLAIAGLIIFAFFETNENYKITHSLWHVCISTSVVFLLPTKTEKEKVSKDVDGVSINCISINTAGMEEQPVL